MNILSESSAFEEFIETCPQFEHENLDTIFKLENVQTDLSSSKMSNDLKKCEEDEEREEDVFERKIGVELFEFKAIDKALFDLVDEKELEKLQLAKMSDLEFFSFNATVKTKVK